MIKEPFDINNFPGEDYMMVCKTREQSEIFRRYLDSIGKRWRSGDSYIFLDYDDSTIGKGIAIGYFFYKNSKKNLDECYEHTEYSLYFDDFSWPGYNDPTDVSFSFEDMLCAGW